MTLLLNTVTIRQASLEDRFRIAAASGYDGLELWGDELDEVVNGVEIVVALARQHNMPVRGVCPHRSLYAWHHSWDTAMERAFKIQMQRYAAIGAKYLVLPVLSEEGTLEDTATALREIASLAQSYNMFAALEPIGHVAKLSRLADALGLLAAIPHTKIIIDVFHFFRGGNRLKELTQVDSSRIAAVHLNDAMDLPLNELLGYKHRVYPTLGIFDVVGFCAAVRQQRYDGPYVVELLNPDYWDDDPILVSDLALRTSREVLRAVATETCP